MTGRAGGKAKAPISSHPVFPAIVALWFAALLGLGSLVLPVVLLERLVAATGLGALVPAVEPPLGVTARILIALVAAGIGAIAGLAVARKVAAAQVAELPAPTRDDDFSQRRAKRPISALEELGISKLDAPCDADEAEQSLLLPGGRRPLAIASESAPSDFFAHAPLPGEGEDDECPSAAEALDLGAFAAPEEPQEWVEPLAAAPPQAELPGEPLHDASEREEPLIPAPIPAVPPAAAPAAERLAEEPAHNQPSVLPNADVASRPLGELGMADLVARFALSLQRRAATEEPPIELPSLRAERAARPVERDESPPPAPPPAASGLPEPVLEPEPEFTAPAMPAALRPIAFDDEDEPADAEPLCGLSLALDAEARPFARPAPALPEAEPALAAEDGDSCESEDDDAGYSSLLAMKRPPAPAHEFVRIEDERAPEAPEPAVVFPGQQRPAAPASHGPVPEPVPQVPPAMSGARPFDGPAPGQRAARVDFSNPGAGSAPPRPVPADTERALRSALEKLQKMSGAA